MKPGKVTVLPDGKMSLRLILDPEVYAMLLKYKTVKGTSDVPVNETINNILKDFCCESLFRPSTYKSSIKQLNKFDEFDIAPGK